MTSSRGNRPQTVDRSDMRHLHVARTMRTIDGMKRAILVLAMMALATGAARADRRMSLDPRVALVVDRDRLMPLDEPTPVVVQPRLDVARSPAAGHPRLWRAIDTTFLVASTATLAIDWRQTRGAAMERWSDGRWEGGYPAHGVIGLHPSARSVDCYFAVAAAMNVALWIALPARWRSVIPGFVVGAEAWTIAGNLSTTHL